MQACTIIGRFYFLIIHGVKLLWVRSPEGLSPKGFSLWSAEMAAGPKELEWKEVEDGDEWAVIRLLASWLPLSAAIQLARACASGK